MLQTMRAGAVSPCHVGARKLLWWHAFAANLTPKFWNRSIFQISIELQISENK